jgi:hypothetical protein
MSEGFLLQGERKSWRPKKGMNMLRIIFAPFDILFKMFSWGCPF